MKEMDDATFGKQKDSATLEECHSALDIFTKS